MPSCRAGEYNVEYDVELIARQARPEEDGRKNSWGETCSKFPSKDIASCYCLRLVKVWKA